MPHVNVCDNNFYPTYKGLTQRDGAVFKAPPTIYLETNIDEAPVLVDEVDTLGSLDVPVLAVENVAVGELSEDIGMVENI